MPTTGTAVASPDAGQEIEAPKAKSPAFQFYPSDFMGDQRVALMTTEQIGAYILLLSHDWLSNGLPTDLDDLAALAKMEETRFGQAWEKRLRHCFVAHPDRPGLITNPRLLRERVKQGEFRAKQAANGAKGGRPRKETQAEPNANPGLSQAFPNAAPPQAVAIAEESPAVVSGTARTRAPRPAAAEVEKPVAWNRDAAGLWAATIGAVDKSLAIRISKALKPLVDERSWEVIRPVWDYYLEHETDQYVAPEAFARKVKTWERQMRAAAEKQAQDAAQVQAIRATILTSNASDETEDTIHAF